MKLEIVDVFAEAPLAGNPLAVVRDCAGLPAERMQSIAFEMNFSETTFVTSESADRASVRIFTPTQELPFAGHPTLGTASILAGARPHFTLELKGGDVRVEFVDGVAWMEPPPVELGETYSTSEVADWLALPNDAIDSTFIPQRGKVGPEFLFVPLDSRQRLADLRMDLNKLHALPTFGLFAFTTNGMGDSAGAPDYAARMFFDANGLREDPATGSANSVFAAYLRQNRGDDFTAVVEQGVEMGRPSTIYLEVNQGQIRVGGRVQPVARGDWTFDTASSA